MFKIAGAAAVAALALTGAAALAETDDMPDFPWTEEEFMEAVPEATPELFELIDMSGDGEISEEEYDQAVETGLIMPPQD